jgi:hypothetical protein
MQVMRALVEDLSGAAAEAVRVKVVHKAAQKGVAREGVRVRDKNTLPAGACDSHVHAPAVRHKPYAPRRVAAHRADHQSLLLAPLEPVHRRHLHTLLPRISQRAP